jgi:NADPH:quinone reductase-like Zn-dependent oxidoreductase
MGRYPMPSGAPGIPGLECSGTVVKSGDGVSVWQTGDQLCALTIGDGYGEYAAVPAVQCLPVPGWRHPGRRRRPARDLLHGMDQCL